MSVRHSRIANTSGLLLCAALAGCATTPISSGVARNGSEIPNEWQNPAPNSGTFVVTRDSGLMGSACSQRIYVDGTPIGDLRSGQKVTVYLPAGEHIAGVTANGICGGGSASAQVVMPPGGLRMYRVASGQSGDIKIEPSAF